MSSEETRPTQLKTDTRQWSGGRVRFAVIGWKDKPEKNYIVFEKNFFGKSTQSDQKFILRQTDWGNLKKLVDGDLQEVSGWTASVPSVDQDQISKLILEDPDALSKILENKNILKLSENSLESLDQIAIKLFEVKAERIDLIFKELANSKAEDVNKLGSLLEDLKLNQISMMASLIYQKLRVIDLLEKVTINPNSLERDVHEIFDRNTWLVGKDFEVVQSDKSLTAYLEGHLSNPKEGTKRPDLIAKTIPYSNDILIIELKAPGIKLKADHIGQVLTYKAIIKNNKPNVGKIHCHLYGYEKDSTFVESEDVKIKTFSELISQLRSEYTEYQKIVEQGKESNEDIWGT